MQSFSFKKYRYLGLYILIALFSHKAYSNRIVRIILENHLPQEIFVKSFHSRNSYILYSSHKEGDNIKIGEKFAITTFHPKKSITFSSSAPFLQKDRLTVLTQTSHVTFNTNNNDLSFFWAPTQKSSLYYTDLSDKSFYSISAAYNQISIPFLSRLFNLSINTIEGVFTFWDGKPFLK